MRLGIITLLSALHDEASVEYSHYEFITALKKEFDVSFIDPEEIDTVDFAVVFIGSGGTENYFKSIYYMLPKPVMLLTDGMYNSLAASMEILAWIRALGDESVILHGNPKEIVSQINQNYNIQEAKRKIKDACIGVVGFPSDWLIASDVDHIAVQKKWGVTYRNIQMSELIQRIDKASESKARAVTMEFSEKAHEVKNVTEKDIIEASKVYLGLKELCEDYSLDAVTLRCFELLTVQRTTGCLAVSLLNNEGITAGCEGDMQAVFSMLLLNKLTGDKAFMANPAYIDTSRNEVILAHCTIPTCMAKSYIVDSHFESLKGIGIRGILEPGPATVFKCGGNKLDRYFVSSADILENFNDENMCRTQLRLHMNEDTGYFLTKPIANHHIVVRGDWTGTINNFMRKMGCERV